MSAPDPSDYRLAPLVIARFVGLYLVLFAVAVFVSTAVVAGLALPGDLMVGVLVLGLGGMGVLAWWLRSRAYVVRFDSGGYRVRLVRGVGVSEARWSDVQEVLTATPHGAPCVVLRLRDARTSTIPVDALAVDREQFVRELRQHLQHGQGLRPL